MLAIDPSIRIDLMEAALFCGGALAAYRILLTLVYAPLFGALWQNFIGPAVVARWPSYGQSAEIERPSYLPLENQHPYVVIWNLPPPFDDVTHGIRDGLLLGVAVALLPELFSSLLLTLLLGIVIGKCVWQMLRKQGADRTDQAFISLKELLIYFGAIIVLHGTGYLH